MPDDSIVSKPTATKKSLPLTALKGVGPKLVEKLAKLGIKSQQDLLFHLPFRYEDRTRITPIGSLKPYQFAVIEADIVSNQIVFGKRRSLLCRIRDLSGTMSLRFFHFSAAQKKTLDAGNRIRCFGEARLGSAGLEIYHPEYQLINDNNILLEKNLTPIYPATEGINQARLRTLIRQVVEQNIACSESHYQIKDYIPQPLYQKYGLLNLHQALSIAHLPPNTEPRDQLQSGTHPCVQRLAFEELVAHSLSFLKLRQNLQISTAPRLDNRTDLTEKFLANLEFKLTSAQQRVWQEIKTDLSLPTPMLRMVQGDVGSGKTIIATLAALQAINNNFQAALLSPTEILAEQHFETLSQWLQPLGVNVAFLGGKTKGKLQQQILFDLAQGNTHLLIGTHAIFQADVIYQNLALTIIDEQHRFGVEQRLALKQKGDQDYYQCHQLVMTATPIPRTLAMCAYGELDNSIIDELPPGRKPITTIALPDQRRAEIIARVYQACRQKKQAYWVCTLIEESEALQCQAAEDSAVQLKASLPNLNIGLVHGRLKAADKAQVMADFKAGIIDLLVSTTVIEVGVNVPNASLMIIENPERLGLAQLHQLRGRVGRGAEASYCVLLYRNPLSKNGHARINIMRESNDGFEIAEKDLQLRGPGELLGTRQTGELQFNIVDLARDEHLIEQARAAADYILNHHPQFVDPLIGRWLKKSEQYRQV